MLVENLLLGDPLEIQEHHRHAYNGKKEAKVMQNIKKLDKLADLKRVNSRKSTRQMDLVCKSGDCMTVMLRFLDDMEMSSQDFRRNVYYRISLEPRRLPTDCNKCGAPFSAKHT